MENIKKTWYRWYEITEDEEIKERQFVTPWSDGQRYEYPFNFIFDTVEDAIEAKSEYGAEDEDWVLCKVALEPVV